MKCYRCNQGIRELKNLVRMNEKGVDGIWCCEECLTPEEQAARDPELKRLTDIIFLADRKQKGAGMSEELEPWIPSRKAVQAINWKARALKAEAERDELLKYAGHTEYCVTANRLGNAIGCACKLDALRAEIGKGK